MRKTVEIYYKDLIPEAKAELLKKFNTTEDAENWDVIPLAVIERENGEYDHGCKGVAKPVDRVAEWRRFARHVEDYIRKRTLQKYSMNDANGVDLMTITEPEVCLWNILKYALRLHNGKSKENDLLKVAHYVCLAYSKSQDNNKRKSNMKIIKNGK